MARPRLHVLFTMDCPPMGIRTEPRGPTTWDASARAIDTFCTVLLRGGFAATLFLTPEAADQHAPLCEEYAGSGVDTGLLVYPSALRGAGYRRYLGAYSGDVQREIVLATQRRFEEALGRRPLSVRSAMFSASDETFSVLSAAGFRQASLSSPGRRTPRFHAVWSGAEVEVHFASSTDRLRAGSLPLLEVPATTDPDQVRGGLSPDLALENGTLSRWHQPLIEGRLAWQEQEGVAFRTLCFVTSSRFAYQDRSTRFRQTLDELLDYLRTLDDRCELVPATLSEAYAHFRVHDPERDHQAGASQVHRRHHPA
jgi:hypothetical protein